MPTPARRKQSRKPKRSRSRTVPPVDPPPPLPECDDDDDAEDNGDEGGDAAAATYPDFYLAPLHGSLYCVLCQCEVVVADAEVHPLSAQHEEAFEAHRQELVEIKRARNGRGRRRGPRPERERDQCVVCMAHDATHGFLPCAHRVLCEACAAELSREDRCYICRRDVSEVGPITRSPTPPPSPSPSSSEVEFVEV
eukprot:CAMPEP_0174870230 /NCGR_PEP_ID=MMETSP1114-20130205/69315_1 /TAXON_ID=312471 /ORGANISM="Neobodo designis, Strain CCAP 1951/1" /LENGTH=194 /DNA_ID=CAMNT_0016105501 /DNA_START=81 /DNA_END=661 /DNA_ORIENTATION=-